MTKLPLIAATSVLLVSLVGASSAQDRPGIGSMGGPGFEGMAAGRLMRIADEINLSDEQIDAIREIFDANRDTARDNRLAARDLRASMREATLATPYDAAAVESIADQLSELVAEIAVNRSANLAQVLELLSAEQRADLEALIDERRDGRGKGKRWRGRG